MESVTPEKTEVSKANGVSSSPVTLSPKALEMVRATVADQKLEGFALRIGVIPGGCSGFSYDLDMVKEARAGDLAYEQDGVKLLVDAASAQHLNGTVIDYVEDGMRAGFSFKNPNVKSSCGCGNSFNA